MQNEIPMSPQQLQREADAFKAGMVEYGHLIDNLPIRDRSAAGMREREARIASQPRQARSVTMRQATSIDPNAKFVAEFRAEPAYAKSMTEAEYVSMRRVDDRLDQLMKVPS